MKEAKVTRDRAGSSVVYEAHSGRVFDVVLAIIIILAVVAATWLILTA